jgi:magnesium chelatase family protein
MGSRELQQYCRLSPGSEALLRQAITRFKLSPRAYDRILKVARTIADLAGAEEIPESAVFEAVNYRKAEF